MNTELIYICDKDRHLICEPYSIPNLFRMAQDLEIGRHWYHPGKFPHFDIPKRRVTEIQKVCKMVGWRDIVIIIKEQRKING